MNDKPKDFEGETSAALDHVSTQWVQLHMALSEALGLEFMPNEDIEQYTDAIAALRAELAAAKELVITMTGRGDYFQMIMEDSLSQLEFGNPNAAEQALREALAEME